MSTNTKKLLLIGSKGYERNLAGVRVDCVLWEHLSKVANIRDFDTVILNLFPIQDGERRKNVDWTHFHKLVDFRAAADVLMHGGRIVFVGNPRFTVPAPPSEAHHPRTDEVPFLEWTGIQFHWDGQPGDTVRFETYGHDQFKEFVTHLHKWDYSLDGCNPNRPQIQTRFDLQELEKRYNFEIDRDFFCQNRYKNAVAFAVRLRFSRSRNDNLTFGWLLFLPRISLDEDETIQLVLRDVCGVETNLPEPNWLSGYTAPGQGPVDAKIEAIKTEIRAKLQALEGLEDERANVRKCLKLLYEREFGLEPAVRDIMRALGAQVEEPIEKNKEDGWLVVTAGGQTYEAVLEIKSTKSDQFSEEGRKQLLDWIDRGRTLRGKNYKGILIGNSAVTKPVTERPEAFSDSWKKAAVLSGICAIKSEDLYEIYRLHRDGRANMDGFWQAVFKTDGILLLKQVLPSVLLDPEKS